ncbi:VacJ family lipoprotein [Ideonella sp. 4Y11]|uniref:VacJ family lipoprotein n=1 Tax=Ideonella aquatica TaxID=2824119 RepID=A0A940YDD5_9BURK|nr:VacJ family lipoprotein [Ideonella aquatica]MBQ0958100.1 VacJ family lipoprotein [Ideonella aquatica]
MKTAALLLVLGLSATPLWAQSAAPEAADAAASTTSPTSPKDPFERGNRAVYRFNDSVDKAVLKPVAEAYVAAVPELVRSGVGNFFGNIGDVWSAVNKLLQGKVVQGAQMTMRVATNTVFGLGGLLDPATEMGLERQSEDFGQTLGYWGVPSGPYLVLPLFGPSTLRDAAALPLDKTAVNIGRVINDDGGVIAANGLQLTQTRSELLGASKLLGDVSLDPYAFLRDAYLARRRNLVWDGDPPDEDPAQ